MNKSDIKTAVHPLLAFRNLQLQFLNTGELATAHLMEDRLRAWMGAARRVAAGSKWVKGAQFSGKIPRFFMEWLREITRGTSEFFERYLCAQNKGVAWTSADGPLSLTTGERDGDGLLKRVSLLSWLNGRQVLLAEMLERKAGRPLLFGYRPGVEKDEMFSTEDPDGFIDCFAMCWEELIMGFNTLVKHKPTLHLCAYEDCLKIHMPIREDNSKYCLPSCRSRASQRRR